MRRILCMDGLFVHDISGISVLVQWNLAHSSWVASLNPLLGCNTLPCWGDTKCEETMPSIAFSSWMSNVRVDRLSRGNVEPQFNLLFGISNHSSFDPMRWSGPEATFLGGRTQPSLVGRGSLPKLLLENWFWISSGIKFYLPPPLNERSSDTNTSRRWWWMNVVGESQGRLTKVVPVVGKELWNW